MRFAATAAALVAFASSVLAQTAGFDVISKPLAEENIPVGTTYDIVWADSSAQWPGTVTIQLMGGATPGTLQILDTIASGVASTAGTYPWTVAAGLGTDATYGIKIYWDANDAIFQYSNPFHIEKNNGQTTTTTSTHTLTSTITISSSAHWNTTTTANNTMTMTKSGSSTASTTPMSSWTTTAGLPTMTTVTNGAGASSTSPAGPTSSVNKSGATHIAAGSFAVIGGLAMVLLAL